MSVNSKPESRMPRLFGGISVAVLGAVVLACSSTATSHGAGTGCADPEGDWIWCDDFETNRLASYFEVETDAGSLARVDGAGRNGSWGMRSRFGASQSSAGSLKLAFGRTPDSYFRPVDDGTEDYREIYWRLYLKHEPTWTGGGGDKLARLTIFADDNWAQAMIAHVWSGSGGDRNFLLLDPASGTDAAGTLRTTQYNDFSNLRWLGAARGDTPIFDGSHVGRWYCVEARVRLNTPGQSDGLFEMWIDDQSEASRTGLNWVGSYTLYGLNALFVENFWNDGSPVAQERYFDDLVVSKSRIGC
jgi:hypothetical protein